MSNATKPAETASSPLDFFYGELNPINMGAYSLVTPDMIIDNKMAVFNNEIAAATRPNVFNPAKTYRGLVVWPFMEAVEDIHSAMVKRVQNIGPSHRCAALVYIPELHACPNPLILPDAKNFASLAKLLPKFVGEISETDTQEVFAPIGSIIEVGWEDNNFSYGIIKKVLIRNTDQNLSEVLATARELIEDAAGVVSAAAGEASAWDPETINCDSPTKKTRNAALQLTEEQVAAWKYIAPFLPEGSRLSSGLRASDQQANIIIRYARSENLAGASSLEPSDSAGVESARQTLISGKAPSGKKYAIGPVKRDPDAPNEKYTGHFAGLAIDISGGDTAFLRSVEAAVRTAENSVEGFSTTLILPELPPNYSNMCIHVEVPKGLTFDPEALKTGWQEATGCTERDPNEEINDISSNYDWDNPTSVASNAEGSQEDNSDQLPEDA
tara:strand:+ start:4754 stop:6076 length:1323 start_codon:yes stop_codon:yes gene_type:complete